MRHNASLLAQAFLVFARKIASASRETLRASCVGFLHQFLSERCYVHHMLRTSRGGSVAKPRSMLNIAIFDPWQRSLFSRQRTPGKEPLLAGNTQAFLVFARKIASASRETLRASCVGFLHQFLSERCYVHHMLRTSRGGSVAKPRSMLNIAIFDPWQRSLFSRQRTPGKEPLLAGNTQAFLVFARKIASASRETLRASCVGFLHQFLSERCYVHHMLRTSRGGSVAKPRSMLNIAIFDPWQRSLFSRQRTPGKEPLLAGNTQAFLVFARKIASASRETLRASCVGFLHQFLSERCYVHHMLRASRGGSVAKPRSMLNIAIFDPWQRSLFSRQRTPGKEPLLAGNTQINRKQALWHRRRHN